jgi:hypothetical protein
MKTLLLLLISTVSYSQTLFRMPMSIRETPFSGENRFYKEDVIWGIKEDTICFLFNETVRCYYPLNRITKSRLSKRSRKQISKHFYKYSKPGDKHFLLQDFRNEIYIIRIVDENGVLIYIINLEYGYPNYTLRFAP